MANATFTDDEGCQRDAGRKWLITGPRDYIPPIEVEVLETRESIPLDKNEGIYVRNNNTGEVRAHVGSTYSLQATESLWEKELTLDVEILLNEPNRNKTRVIRYNVPHNRAM